MRLTLLLILLSFMLATLSPVVYWSTPQIGIAIGLLVVLAILSLVRFTHPVPGRSADLANTTTFLRGDASAGRSLREAIANETPSSIGFYERLGGLVFLASALVLCLLTLVSGLVFAGLVLANSGWQGLIASGAFTSITVALLILLQYRPPPYSGRLTTSSRPESDEVSTELGRSPVNGGAPKSSSPHSEEERTVGLTWSVSGWEVRLGGETRLFARQWPAEQWARKLARASRPSRLVVRNKKGGVTRDYRFSLIDRRRKIISPSIDRQP
jgi:hypothetical protein